MREPCNVQITQFDYTLGGATVDVARARHRVREFPLHIHDCYSVAVVVGGEHIYQHGRVKKRADRGSVVFTNPGQPHANIAANENGWECVNFQFEADLLADVLEQQGLSNRDFEFSESMVQDAFIGRQLQHLQDVAFSQQGRLYKDQMVAEVLRGLVGKYAVFTPAQDGIVQSGRSVELCKQYLNDNAALNISLADLAELTGFSGSYLCRVFKKHTGMSPYAYLINARVNKAADMLKKGLRPAEVAYATGFADQSHLNRHFKHYAQTTPGKFFREVNIVQEHRPGIF